MLGFQKLLLSGKLVGECVCVCVYVHVCVCVYVCVWVPTSKEGY